MPVSWYSIGSSTVTTLRAIVFSLSQAGVERRRLAAAGRAGDQHHAVRQFQRPFEAGPDVLGQAELFVVEIDGGAVEHAQHHLLAVERRHRRHAEVDLVAAHRQLDAAVLRQPALGDVEPRHDLDARDDRGLQPRRRRLDLVQHAVIAVAHPQPVGERLEMDVGGMGFDRARDHLVDQADHRRLAGEVLEPLGILLGGLGVGDDLVQHRLAVAFRRPARNKAGRVPLRARSAPRPRPRPAGRCAAATALRVNTSSGSTIASTAPLVALGDRQRVRLAQEFGPQPIDEQRLVGVVCRRHQRCRDQLRQRLGEPALADQAELRQHPVEPAAGLGGDAARALQGALVDGAAVDQRRAEPGQRLGGILRGR